MVDANAAQLKELREKVLSAVESMSPGEYHPNDIEKFQKNDKWVLRFLQHQEFDVNQAYDMAIDCIKWRKKFGVHNITEDTLSQNLLKLGAIYEYTHDKAGHKILMFHCRKNHKDQSLYQSKKKILVYWVEKMEQAYDGEKITVFFDMTDAGISNMDMDLIKFFISLFKYYYPFFLANLFVYEMPWILNAAWKVIKTWLSARAVDKIKFVSKGTVQEYIAADQLPQFMGGTNTFKYHYKLGDDSDSLSSDSEQYGNSITPRKKVHFAVAPDKFSDLSGGDVKNNFIQNKNADNFMYFNGRFLRISPAEELVFKTDVDGDNAGSLNLVNDTEKNVAFKVKTTTPEKFRVRPSSGMIKPMSRADVLVQLQTGYQNSSLIRDKFLVMAMEVDADDITNQELTELWKNCPRENIMEHKLRCSLLQSHLPKEPLEIHQNSVCKNAVCQHAVLEIKSLQKTITNLKREMYVLFTVLVMVMVLTLVLIVIIWGKFDLTASKEYSVDSCINTHPT